MLIEQFSKKFLDSLMQHDWKIPAKHDLRVSSLPYCSILDLESRPISTQKEDFSKEFYTSIGTVVHEKVLQNLMPKVKALGETVFGHWQCQTCNKVSEMGLHDEQRKKVVRGCKQKSKCSERFKYEEIAFKYKLLTGHLDLLALSDGNYVPFEFKTTGSALFQPNSYVEKYFPLVKHVYQLKLYNTLLRMQYGIKCNEYNIVYFNRDKPQYKLYNSKFTEDDFKFFKAKIRQANIGYKAVNKWYITKDIEQLKIIVDSKPCKKVEDYNDYMKYKFFGKEVCPHFSNNKCMKIPNKLIKDIVLKQKKWSTK